MRSRTKIICTLGPATTSEEKIGQLIDAGMNVARINMSHGTHAEHQKTIESLKKIRKEKDIPLAIMLDTKGPEVRVGTLAESIALKEGDTLTVSSEPKKGEISLNPQGVVKDIHLGHRLLFDDGLIIGEVIKKEET